jgi:hypothetical protein
LGSVQKYARFGLAEYDRMLDSWWRLFGEVDERREAKQIVSVSEGFHYNLINNYSGW